MRSFAFLRLIACVVLGLAHPFAARAETIGAVMVPTDKLVLYRFESIPPGATIEYNGEVTEYLTDDQFRIRADAVESVWLWYDGYLPCGAKDAEIEKSKFGKAGPGMLFVCSLVSESRPPEREPELGPRVDVED